MINIEHEASKKLKSAIDNAIVEHMREEAKYWEKEILNALKAGVSLDSLSLEVVRDFDFCEEKNYIEHQLVHIRPNGKKYALATRTTYFQIGDTNEKETNR